MPTEEVKFDKKLLTVANINQLIKIVNGNPMISGNAIKRAMIDLRNLRILIEALYKVHSKNDIDKEETLFNIIGKIL